MDKVSESDVLVDAENQAEMIEKLEKRYEEQEKKALQTRKARSPEELQAKAVAAIQEHANRRTSSREKVEQGKILRDAKAKDITELRTKLSKEISDFAQARLRVGAPSEESQPLKGRIKKDS